MKHKAKPSSSGRGSRLRLAILAAAVAAFFLVPVAQAAASTIKVNIAGTGSGKVKDHTFYNSAEPEPIDCSYAGGSKSGVCEGTIAEGNTSETLAAYAGEGSEFVGWTITKGKAAEGGFVLCDGGEEEKGFVAFWSTEFPEEFGGMDGACAIEPNEAGEAEITATFNATAPKFTLTVDRTSLSTGSGTVVSSPSGIECGATCSAEFEEGSTVTLTASAATDSVFTSWSGCTKTIEGTGAKGRTCTVQITKAMTVKAKFTAVKAITASKDSESSGQGTISSAPGGIACGPACTSATAVFTEGQTVLLKAVPVPSTSEFNSATGWTGCDSVNGEGKCVVVASAAKAVEAKFTAIPQNTLAFEKKGKGTGTVSSAPAGISCGPTCPAAAASYLKTKTVLLKAVPSVGSSFTSATGWSGCDSVNGEGKCVVAMTSAKAVTAEFK